MRNRLLKPKRIPIRMAPKNQNEYEYECLALVNEYLIECHSNRYSNLIRNGNIMKIEWKNEYISTVLFSKTKNIAYILIRADKLKKN